MGRPTTASSCLKLITCGGGGDTADDDDLRLPLPETKGSSEKRGWSFRKRSARHRVLSNNVILENLTSENKESAESFDSTVQKSDALALVEKLPVVECQDEKLGLSVSTEQKVSETVGIKDGEDEVDSQPEEFIIIVIQTAIRAFLAERELLKLKNVVKLQAAVRGHMVRQHAIGTLRCVQAIVKMQALVRSRHARQLKEVPLLEKESGQKCGTVSSKTLEKEQCGNLTCISLEKLLSNSFARQLIESTPKNKPINIKCDPLKPNSAWNWLERWMSVSSAEPTPITEMASEKLEAKIESVNYLSERRSPSKGTCDSLDMKMDTKGTVLPSEVEENLITDEAKNFKFEAFGPTSSNDINWDLTCGQETSAISNSTDPLEQPETNLEIFSHNPQLQGEQPDEMTQCVEKPATDQLETKGGNYVLGSRKASNPLYIAAQSKFGELSSAGTLNRKLSKVLESSNKDTFLSGFETATGANEVKVVENMVPHNLSVHYGDSECGTELSVTSTLDTPDGSDAGAAIDEHEAKVTAQQMYNSKGTEEYFGTESKGKSVNPEPNLSSSVADETDKFDGANGGESLTSRVAADSPEELKPERNASVILKDGDFETCGPAYPEASPRSHVTVAESLRRRTPSSQVSVKAEKSRTDKSSSSLKRKSLSSCKRSPSHLSYEAVEQLTKDQHSGKRRNSLGSARPEHAEEEPGNGSSNNSLPHFMQVTESAKAKMNPNSSPRSSPDVQDGEYVKKRHSLPGANGWQGSPRIQQSMSQAKQGTKGNGGYVHEKKWQR